MNEQKLTDWFPPEVLPARAGPYLREYWADRQYWMNEDPDYFDGKHWYYGNSGSLASPVLRWRGLAEPPLTDWFPPEVLPARPGVYEIDREDCDGRAFSHWDGKRWGWATWERFIGGFQNAIDAAAEASRTDFNRRWRGLAVQP